MLLMKIGSIFFRGNMNGLKQKYLDYMRLINCKAEYELEDGTKIDVTYKEENFAHLLGLHKLKDIQLVQFWLDKSNKTVKHKTILNKIKNESLTENMLKESVFYQDIQERYENFSYENLTTLNYTDAIINFNPNIINSKMKSDYILFEETEKQQYNHMGIARNAKTGNRYVETFFHERSDNYIVGQKVIKIKTFSLYDANDNLIIRDIFS